MKIAVYTIALNEEKHVTRWYESAKDADLLLIADTGSSDKTKFIAKSHGITVHEISVVPWRFDVARNASLALIPEDFDICIQLDMDEVLQPGWRQKVEAAFLAGNNWPSYREVTSRNSNGEATAWFNHHRIHPRKGFIWKYPIHEIIQPSPGTEYKRDFIDLEIDHIQDQNKSRRSYLSLLEMAVKEQPNDWRMRHYLNREYWYNKAWNNVLSSAYEAMEISEGWDVERASTCMWASEAAHILGLKKLSIEWAEKATSEAPNFYEAWHWRAHISHLYSDWESCRDFSFKRLTLERQNHHLVKPEVWEWWGYDLMGLSSHNLNLNIDAFTYGEMARKNNQSNKRLEKNLEIYCEKLMHEIIIPAPLNLKDKLEEFPRIYYINMDSSLDRNRNFKAQMANLGISNYERVSGLIAPNLEDKLEVHRVIYQSHLKAISEFLDSGENWALICEDDLSFSMVDLWPFKIKAKIGQLEKLSIDILQMCLVTAKRELMICALHARRENIDWGASAYLISRQGAAQIMEKSKSPSKLVSNVECDLFDNLKVYSEALLVSDPSLGSTFQPEHVGLYHGPSFDVAIENMLKIHKAQNS